MTGRGMANLPSGIEEDGDVLAGLEWLGQVSGDADAFLARLTRAQRSYRSATSSPGRLGQDPDLRDLGNDLVGSYLAQAKSLLDDRRAFDFALASRTVPWIKQLGVNVGKLSHVPGAAARAIRMLRDTGSEPDGVLLELVMAGNYASEGFEVAFIEEEKGQAKTPDIQLSAPSLDPAAPAEFKRLRRGAYESREQSRHKALFRHVAELIDERRLSVYIDVTYTQELEKVPDSYLASWLVRALSSRVATLGHYPWRDEFGSGEIRAANLDAVKQDIQDSSLYFGTKMARLLSGHVVRETGYHLVAGATPDTRDPRFVDKVHYASVVTWQCIAAEAIEKKARHVKAKLVEADRQLERFGPGILHLAMDMEHSCQSSDLRRERNKVAITEFRSESLVAALYVHYLVPRVSEAHSWLIDETVDRFGVGSDPVAPTQIFARSKTMDNDLPAWQQVVPVPKP